MTCSSVVVSGNNLYVANVINGIGNSTVGKYNATTGATINASLITGLSGPQGMAFLGNELFVSNSGTGVVGVYDATTGAAINANFITGLTNPASIAIVPEAAVPTSILLGIVTLLGLRRRQIAS